MKEKKNRHREKRSNSRVGEKKQSSAPMISGAGCEEDEFECPSSNWRGSEGAKVTYTRTKNHVLLNLMFRTLRAPLGQELTLDGAGDGAFVLRVITVPKRRETGRH